MMGGTMRSPLTAVVFLMELTGDVALLPALLVACVAAHALTVLLMKRSILTEKVARRGYHVTREYAVSPFARYRVEDVMERDVPTIPSDTPVDVILRRLLEHDPVLGVAQAWPIVDDRGALAGLVTRGDLVRALNGDGDDDQTVLDVGARSLVVTYPDELLESALHKMSASGVGRLPVVLRDDETRLAGMLGGRTIAAAYRFALDEEHVRAAGDVRAAMHRMRRRLFGVAVPASAGEDS
jgi:CBS domain-containing protein